MNLPDEKHVLIVFNNCMWFINFGKLISFKLYFPRVDNYRQRINFKTITLGPIYKKARPTATKHAIAY